MSKGKMVENNSESQANLDSVLLHLAKLKLLKRVGGGMSKEACQDPEKAKYMG